MGIISRQAFKHSVVNYFGVALGFISTIWIYPLQKDIYGLAQWMQSSAFLIIPFASLGVISLTVRFFPDFRTRDNQNSGYLLFLLTAATIALALFFSITYIFRHELLNVAANLDFDVGLLRRLGWKLTVLSIFILYTMIIQTYITNYRRIVVPAIINTLLIKIGLPILVILSLHGILTEHGFVNAWVGIYGVGMIAIILYAIHLGAMDLKFDLSKFKSGILKKMGVFALYSGLSSISGVLAVRIDLIMLGLLLTLDDTGIYAIAMFIAGIIAIPSRAIFTISSPIISQAWKDHDLEKIGSIYRLSSLNLLVPGILIFLLIWHSSDSLFILTSRYDELIKGIWVIFFIGLSQLSTMAASVSNQIIVFSRFYKYNLYFLVALAILNVMLNYFLIRQMGIVGAALATCISVTLLNIVKMIFLKLKFKMQPFTMGSLKILGIGIVGFAIGQFIPQSFHPIVNIMITSICILSVYVFLVIKLKVSQELEIFVKILC